MDEKPNDLARQILERIAETLGTSVSNLEGPFVPNRPPNGSAEQRATAVDDLQKLLAKGIGPRDLIIRLIEVLGSSRH